MNSDAQIVEGLFNVRRTMSSRDKVRAAKLEVYRLCEGGRWRMSVPVDEMYDSDRIIVNAIDSLSSRLREENLKAAELAFALRDLYTFPGVRDLLAPSGSLGSVADRVESSLRKVGVSA